MAEANVSGSAGKSKRHHHRLSAIGAGDVYPGSLWGNDTLIFRLYHLSGGHIVSFDELHCESDEDAIAEVDRRAGQGAMELWRGATLVRSFNIARKPDGAA